MKSLTINSIVLAVALWTTPSVAGTVEPVSQSDNPMTSATVTTSPASFHALSGLDAETLAAQEMTDQELKTVEGGTIYQTLLAAKGSFGEYKLVFGEGSVSTTYTLQGSCTCTCTP
jgi:bacteriocin-like protein